MLLDRRIERGKLAEHLDAARAGRSSVLVLRGEPGAGKTALLEDAIKAAAGMRVARIAGVEAEMELAFAALQQLSAPMIDHARALPEPQRRALEVAFGLRAGEPPDRFMVGLAALGLLSEAADERPLLCVIDDAQWLDEASSQALAFVARRLLAEPVAMVFATREPGANFTGLPELNVAGLPADDARELLSAAISGPLDDRVRDQLVSEARGNPLALLELSQWPRSAQLAGGFGVLDFHGVSGQLEESFMRRLDALPLDARRLMLVAAAEPTGDAALVRRAAGRLAIGARRWRRPRATGC